MMIAQELIDKRHLSLIEMILLVAITFDFDRDQSAESKDFAVSLEMLPGKIFMNVFDKNQQEADGEYSLLFYVEQEIEKGVQSTIDVVKLTAKAMAQLAK